MADSTNASGLSFWQRYASVYDTFMAKDKHAYNWLGDEICVELTADMNVLELACGTGLVSERIAPACRQLTATDYSEKMITKARKKVFDRYAPPEAPDAVPSNIVFEQADIYRLPYSQHQFDAVVISNGLHIISDPIEGLKHIRRVLKPGGKLIAPTFMHEDSPGNKLFRKPMEWLGFTSYSMWTPDDYKEFFTDNDWSIKRSMIIPASFPINLVIAI